MLLLLLLLSASTALPLSPSQLYGDLFVQVEEQQVFNDSKTFCDLIPLFPPSAILANFSHYSGPLRAFVLAHFEPPVLPAVPSPPPG
jgi:alpha,alpha-trehalase